MDSQAKRLKKLLDQLSGPEIDESDLKSMALAIISDIEGTSAYHARARIEALRLLKDIVVKDKVQSADLSNGDILSLLGNKQNAKKEIH